MAGTGIEPLYYEDFGPDIQVQGTNSTGRLALERPPQKISIVLEVWGGFTTFLALVPILILNSQILMVGGMDFKSSFVGSALASSLATIITSVGGRVPYGCAPSLALTSFLCFGVLKPGLLTPEQAWAACAAAGCALALLGFAGAGARRAALAAAPPRAVKLGALAGAGAQLALVGLRASGLVIYHADSLLALGDLSNFSIWVTMGGIVLCTTFIRFKIPGATLAAVLIMSIIVWAAEASWPQTLYEVPAAPEGGGGAAWAALWAALQGLLAAAAGGGGGGGAAAAASAALAMLVYTLADVSGCHFGLQCLEPGGEGAGEEGSTPPGGAARPALLYMMGDGADERGLGTVATAGGARGARWALLGCGLGTVAAAALGCPPLNLGIESTTGILKGGKTGLSGFVSGILLASLAFIAPCMESVPLAAAAPALILAGGALASNAQEVAWGAPAQAVPAFVTATLVAFTCSLSNGLWFGMGSAAVLYVTTADFARHLPCLLASVRRRYSSMDQLSSPLIDAQADATARRPILLAPKEVLDRHEVAAREATARALHARARERQSGMQYRSDL